MATNVLLRYLFNTGTVWGQELEWHLLSPLILFGMSYALLNGEHVRVDVVYANFAPRTKTAVDIVSAALAIAIALVIVWLSLGYVGQSYAVGEQSADPGGLPHRWLLKALIPVGFGLLALQSLAVLIGKILELKWLRP